MDSYSGFFGKFTLIVFSILFGILAATIAWAFMEVIHIIEHWLWHDVVHWLEHEYHLEYVTILFGLSGGLVLALIQRKFGKIPKSADEIEHDIMEHYTITNTNIPVLFIAASIPLVFGASVDPEVAIITLVVGTMGIVINKIGVLRRNNNNLSKIGLGTAIAVLFGSPLFGYSIAEDQEIKRLSYNKLKAFLYLLSMGSGVITYMVLCDVTGTYAFALSFPEGTIDGIDYLWLNLFAVVGILLGYVFAIQEVLLAKFISFVNKDFIFTILVGGVIGLAAITLNETLSNGDEIQVILSGKYQLKSLSKHLSEYNIEDIQPLLKTGFLKITLTAVCLTAFWKGGEIFPLMYGGALVGLALALQFDVDPTAAIAVTMGGLVSFVTKKPIAIFMLFIMFFPTNTFMLLMIVLIISNILPKPDILTHKHH